MKAERNENNVVGSNLAKEVFLWQKKISGNFSSITRLNGIIQHGHNSPECLREQWKISVSNKTKSCRHNFITWGYVQTWAN